MLTRKRKCGPRPKWSHADYLRFAAYYDAHPDKSIKDCYRDLGCGQPAMQIALPLSERWKRRLYS